MAQKASPNADVEKTVEGFLTMLKASDLSQTGDEIVAAVKLLVQTYVALKTDTEAERTARTTEFAAALRDLDSRVTTRLAGVKDGAPGMQGPKGDSVPGPSGPQGIPGLAGPQGPAGSPDTADEIRNKLEILDVNKRLKMEAIRGLTEALDELRRSIHTAARSGNGGNGGNVGVSGRDIFSDIDLSAQLDGLTSTFQIHAVYNVISVVLSSYPTALRKNIDFSYTPTTITFLATIDPATQLQAGQQCVLTVVNA